MPALFPTRSTIDGAARAPVQGHHEFVGLDILRLVACLSVLLYHYTFRGAARDGMTGFSVPAIQWMSKYGFLGVDLFFIISGFVIAYSAVGRSATHFLLSRFIRLYPAFIVCMPISFLVAWLFGLPEITVTLPQFAANLVIVSPVFHQGFVDGVYWSIVCEIVFYGWVLVLIRFGALGRPTPVVVLVWLSLSLVNETVLHSTALAWILLTKYSGFFAAGAMLHHGRFNGWGRLATPAMAGAVLVANLQLFGDVGYHNAYYGGTQFDAGIALGLCDAAIGGVGAIVFLERCERRPPLVLLGGGITYPLYLLHQNIGYVAFNRLKGSLPDPVLLVAVSGALLVLAWVIWRYVERPAQRWLKALLLSRTAIRWPFGFRTRAA